MYYNDYSIFNIDILIINYIIITFDINIIKNQNQNENINISNFQI